MRYWVYSDSRILGPFGREELVSVQGLNGSSLVCSETVQGLQDADWTPLAAVAELSSLELARGAVPAAAGPAMGLDEPFGFEPPLSAPWDDAGLGRAADARWEAERERERELEDRVLSLREEIAGYESRQDQILEALSRKDRQLALRDQAIEEMRGRLEGLERRVSGGAPVPAPKAAPVPAPAAAAPAPAPVSVPTARQAREPVFEEIVPAPAPAPTPVFEAPAAAPPPAPEQPMGFESPRPSPLKSSSGLPAGTSFSPPAPGPEAPAVVEQVVVFGGDGIAREPLDVALNSAPPAPPAAPASPPLPEIRVLGPGPMSVAVAPPAGPSSTLDDMAGGGGEFGPLPPAPAAPPPPAQAEAPVFAALGPDAVPPPLEGPVLEEPAAPEAREVERFEQPRTLVFGDKSQSGAEPILESLVSLSPFTPRPVQTGAARPPEAAEAFPPASVTPVARPTTGIGRPPTAVPSRLSRVERPPELTPGAARGGPAGRQKIFLGVVAGAGLCLGTLLFLFLRNPRQVVQTVSMDPSDMRRRSAPAAGADAPPQAPAFPPAAAPAAPFAAPPPEAPAAAPAQAAAPAEKSRDYVSQDQRIRALEFVKEYSLGGGRGTIEQWFKYAFPVSANAEVSWHAAALSASEYHVSYEVVKKGESGRTSKPIANYGFEVDMTAGTVSGTTPEARDLLASAGGVRKPAPGAQGQAL